MIEKIGPKIRIVFFIIVFIFSFFIDDLSAGRKEEFKMIRDLEKTVEEEHHVEIVTRPKVEYEAGDSRDPFQPLKMTEMHAQELSMPESTVRSLPALTVQGLVWGGNFPQAIINNKVVKEGDTLEEARIISIKKEGVTVFFEGGEYQLSSPAAGPSPSKKTQGGGAHEKYY